MNFYTLPHKHYCGVDLHSRTMYLCIVGRGGLARVTPVGLDAIAGLARNQRGSR